jgi:hypothetical protein
MTVKTGTTALSLMLALVCVTFVHARDLLFLGLTDTRGASVQPELEQALRHEFTANPAFGIIGELETQRVVREIEKQGRTRTESWLPPGAGIADSVIVVKGIVTENAMNIKRHWLAWGKIDGRMTVKLYFNEVAEGGASYHGQFGASASKPKNFILFQNPQKTVHISAIDRSELLGKMRAKIIKDVSEFTARWIKTLPAHKPAEKTGGDEPVTEYMTAIDSAADENGTGSAGEAAIDLITVPDAPADPVTD